MKNLLKIFLFLVLVITFLDAKEKTWYQKINPSIEAGMHLSVFKGYIKNANSTTNIQNDLNYKDSSSSYFALGLRTDYTYMPNFKVDYFHHTQNQDTNLSKIVYAADGVFDANTTVSSKIDYSVMNFIIYHDFKHKGRRFKFLRWNFYPGDLEWYVGVNIKYINWRFDIEKSVNPDKLHWIQVNEVIPLPYIGFYYLYKHLRVYADISALAYQRAKSTNYNFGFAYQVYRDLYISWSYLYEDFQATEKRGGHTDTIRFSTSGNKFSFKYIF